MKFTLAYSKPCENWLIQSLLDSFIATTASFICVLKGVNECLYLEDYCCEFNSLSTLIPQMYEYVSSKKVEILELLDSIQAQRPPESHSENLVYLFNPKKKSTGALPTETYLIKDLVASIIEYQKTITMFTEQLWFTISRE